MAEAQPLQLSERRTFTYRLCAESCRVSPSCSFDRPSPHREHSLEGPVIIAPIHRSNVDFALTLFISKRRSFSWPRTRSFAFRSSGRSSHISARSRSIAARPTVNPWPIRRPYFARVTPWCSSPKEPARKGSASRRCTTGRCSWPRARRHDRARRDRRQRPSHAQRRQTPTAVQDQNRRGTRDRSTVVRGRVSRSALTAKSEELREPSRRCTSRVCPVDSYRRLTRPRVAFDSSPPIARVRRVNRQLMSNSFPSGSFSATA